METIKIVEYSEKNKGEFRRLNLEWIEKYFVAELTDEYVLSNPKETIIDKDGFVYFAECENKTIGTFALIKVDNETFELAKMAVTTEYQNRGIGKHLMDFAIDKARQLNAKRLILYSNSNLLVAVSMYLKYGFREIPKNDFHNNRANMKMEIIL